MRQPKAQRKRIEQEKEPWKKGDKVIVTDATYVKSFVGMRGTVVKCFKAMPHVEWSAEVDVLPSVKGGVGKRISVFASALKRRTN